MPLVVAVTTDPLHWARGTGIGSVMLEGVAAPTATKSTILPAALRSMTATLDVAEAVQLMFAPVENSGNVPGAVPFS